MTTLAAARPLGDFLREWRRRRRMSQLDLALEAEISQRHLSFIESGRAAPSRDMLLHLAERLEVPLRDRNPMLLAAGFAPVFVERRLDDPALQPARRAIEMVLKGHEPFPALAIDRHWTLVAANAAVAPLLADVADRSLMSGPVNVLRLSLHPGAWHRTSPISPNGAIICSNGCTSRSPRPAIVFCKPCSKSLSDTRCRKRR